MPEGDTIFRTATSMQRWIGGRTVTAVRTKVRGLEADRLVGTTVEAVEPKAKHLLVRFSNGLVLHTHMRMTGSWHVYSEDDRWQKPEHQAKFVLQCGERLAVCFNAPVVELLLPSEERHHGALNGLGPDVLGPERLDLDEVRRRAASLPDGTTVGELLLEQRAVSGIGNIYRCEALFLERVDPWALVRSLPDEVIDRLVGTAARLMQANARSTTGARGFGAPSGRPWVYGRTGLPCRVCGTPVRTAPLGARPRDVHWCPTCQQSDEAH